LERVGDGLWALVSTPFEDRTTLCNGGIVAGTDGVLVVESFATPDGAAWMARQAEALTGRPPTHVALTHFHGDHTNGLEGFDVGAASPDVLTTNVTRDLVRDADAGRDAAPAAARVRMLDGVTVVDPARESVVELGGRSVRIVPREGHTPSDVTVEIDAPSVVWCGDLVWNRMFPNYRDAIPSRLSRDVRALVRSRETTYVPGHGPLADADDLARYIDVIDHVEAAARRAFERGIAAAEAAQTFALPAALGEWVMFSPRYYEVALRAWERELAGA